MRNDDFYAESSGLLHSEDRQSIDEPRVSIPRRDPKKDWTEWRTNMYKTAAYCLCYLSMGLYMNGIGPTILLLASHTDSTLEQVSSLFTARGVGWICGSLISAKAISLVNGHRALYICHGIVAVMTVMIVWVTNLWGLIAIFLIAGVLMGIADVASNTNIYLTWKEKMEPYLQLLHVFYGIGCTVSPFVVGTILAAAPEGKEIFWSYLILGVLQFPCVFAPFFLTPPADEDPEEHAQSVKEDKYSPYNLRFWGLVALIATFLFLYIGIENGFGAWIFTYAVTEFNMPEPEAAYLSAGFWTFITIGRIISVPLAAHLSSKYLLMLDLAGCIVFIGLCSAAALSLSKPLLWISSLGLGLFMSNVYATSFGLPNSVGYGLTTRAASVMLIGTSTGDMLLPVIQGILIVKVGPNALIWSEVVIIILLVGLFAVFWFVFARRHERKSHHTPDKGGYELL